MTEQLQQIVSALGWTMPCDLAEVAARLGDSVWPEVATCWSRLTPTGCPIELTVADGSPTTRWTSEIAGPEMPDDRRLDLVARRLEEADQPVPTPLLEALRAAQRGQDLQYGAWLGGRVGADRRSWFKLYAEIPAGIVHSELPLPPSLKAVAAHSPNGTLARMLGIEPARDRIELYMRLPAIDVDDLRPMLLAAGHPDGADALAHHLPDGIRRLAGRRLGISLSATNAGRSVEMALFVSARTFFPGAPELLGELVPAIATLPESLCRLTLVTIRMTQGTAALSFAIGVTIPRQRLTVH